MKKSLSKITATLGLALLTACGGSGNQPTDKASLEQTLTERSSFKMGISELDKFDEGCFGEEANSVSTSSPRQGLQKLLASDVPTTSTSGGTIAGGSEDSCLQKLDQLTVYFEPNQQFTIKACGYTVLAGRWAALDSHVVLITVDGVEIKFDLDIQGDEILLNSTRCVADSSQSNATSTPSGATIPNSENGDNPRVPSLESILKETTWCYQSGFPQYLAMTFYSGRFTVAETKKNIDFLSGTNSGLIYSTDLILYYWPGNDFYTSLGAQGELLLKNPDYGNLANLYDPSFAEVDHSDPDHLRIKITHGINLFSYFEKSTSAAQGECPGLKVDGTILSAYLQPK